MEEGLMSPAKKDASGITAEEKEAVKAWRREVRARKGKPDPAQGENDVLAAIAAMVPDDKAIAERVHQLVKAAAPELVPRTFYGMPAYARDDKVICYFQNAGKFKARYSTFTFSDKARLDDGNMWPVSYALPKLGPAEEAKIIALVKQAMG
jgi:uncharacterized protein YdhG (YjbR/CyaY superfamily)